jgi:hypothetical protein
MKKPNYIEYRQHLETIAPIMEELRASAPQAIARALIQRGIPNAQETVSKLGVLCGTTLLAARRLGESNVVLFECSVHNRRPHLEHEVCSSR